MWHCQQTLLDGGFTLHCLIQQQGQPLSVRQVLEHWRYTAPFRDFFVDLLAATPFDAYFWETPPMTVGGIERDFEFVLVNSRQLAGVNSDRHTFARYFTGDDQVVSFDNLGGDAVLIAPAPIGSPACYSHLAEFSRTAPVKQQHALWQQTGISTEQHLGVHPLWLNTSGLGVYWLHIRLDCRPKYYTHVPYKTFAD